MDREEFLACLERARKSLEEQQPVAAEPEEDLDACLEDPELARQVMEQMGLTLEDC